MSRLTAAGEQRSGATVQCFAVTIVKFTGLNPDAHPFVSVLLGI